MRNVKNAHYFQIDHQIKNISQVKGVEILSSLAAWKKYNWARKYFSLKPKEGYFIWVKKQVSFPLFTCILLCSKNITQNLQNLLIIEKNLKISLQGTCQAAKKNLLGAHKAQGKIILKEGSSLKYKHFHSWGQKDIVTSCYEFFLEKNSKLDYVFKTLSTPRKLRINTSFNLLTGASCNAKIVANCKGTETEIKDNLILKEKEASGQVQIRLVAREASKVSAYSKIEAQAESRGHLDCQGLVLDKGSEVSLVPELLCKNKKAQITHEASIGKISQEQLNYLRMRGLTEKEATNLIINGFLTL